MRLFQRLAQLLRDVQESDRHGALLRLLWYILTVAAGDDPGPLLDAIRLELGQGAKDEAMGLLNSMMERGHREGFAEGKAEGKADGARATLKKLLQLKFGPLPTQAVAALEAMDLRALDAASERVLTASRLDEVLAGS